jgi:hypothetical protein
LINSNDEADESLLDKSELDQYLEAKLKDEKNSVRFLSCKRS